MKITLSYEIGDRILFKAPIAPLKFREFVGTIDDITLHTDEESDTSNTVYVINVNDVAFYNISYSQIVAIDPSGHEHNFREICEVCGCWMPSMDPHDELDDE